MPEDPSEQAPGPSPSNGASGRRSFLRAAAWGGGLAGFGGLAGLGLKRLTANRPPTTPKAPLGAEFTYDVARFQTTDPSLLKFTESARFAVDIARPKAVALAPDGSILVGGQEAIRKFSAAGETTATFPLSQPVHALAVRPDGSILVGQPGRIAVLDANGTETAAWTDFPEGMLPTSIAVTTTHVFVADAGTRVVHKLSADGKPQGVIGARDPERNLKGFVVPSPYFCVRMAPDGLLRITNPGEHQIEAFTLNGDLEIAWGKGSFAVEGFCGCCNPVSIEVFPDGSFVTAEKGLPRVKLYDSHGDFAGLVAGPEAFPDYLQAANAGTPDTLNTGLYVAITPDDAVVILDAVGGSIRIMQRKP